MSYASRGDAVAFERGAESGSQSRDHADVDGVGFGDLGQGLAGVAALDSLLATQKGPARLARAGPKSGRKPPSLKLGPSIDASCMPRGTATPSLGKSQVARLQILYRFQRLNGNLATFVPCPVSRRGKREAEPVPTQWRSLSVPKGLAKNYTCEGDDIVSARDSATGSGLPWRGQGGGAWNHPCPRPLGNLWMNKQSEKSGCSRSAHSSSRRPSPRWRPW